MLKSGKRKAFTLVELLVVMTIIAVLSSLLLPALIKTREMARRVVCLSNLRQIHIAAKVYANSYDGYYPPAYWFDPPPLSFYDRPRFCTTYAWDFTTITDTVTGEKQVIPGILWQEAGDMKIQQCPSFTGAANWLSDPYTGYNYNTSYIGHGYLESIPEPARTTDVKSPSTCALFGDGEYGGGANKFMRAPWPNPGDANFSNAGRYAGTQGYRHMGYTNVVYCDGHAESVRECYSETSKKEKVAPGTGFLSPDNSAYDLK
ncbi:prepilin-type N-terminal cleavage/methylation domain-containing protein [bacterium]|nr:prepilin-type N-terminal cleavage/methylation domain-containing protein [bacterium]